MGIFSRIRGASTHPSSTTQQRPITPLPSEASGSIAEGEITPKAKEKKPFSLWKGKGRADSGVGGRRYEDHSLRGDGQSAGLKGHAHPGRSGAPRQSGAWDRDSIYSERPASPLDPPSRIWGQGQAGERQRSASASGIHPQPYNHSRSQQQHAQAHGYAQSEPRTPNQPQLQSLRDAQNQARSSPDRQRLSSDMSRIPPASPSSVRTAPMQMPSNAQRSYPSHPHLTGASHYLPPQPPAKSLQGVDGANRTDGTAPGPATEGGFLGKLTFEDKSTRRPAAGPAQRREREPSWLVGSMEGSSGLFGFSTDPSAASNSSLASSGEAIQGAPYNGTGARGNAASGPYGAYQGQGGVHAPQPSPPASSPPSKRISLSPIQIGRTAPLPPSISPTASMSTPMLSSPPSHLQTLPSLPAASTSHVSPPISSPREPAPSAWRAEGIQAAASTTALPSSLPPSSVSSPVVEQEEDKRGKFWKARGRRSSKAMSDMDHETTAATIESPVTTARQPDASRPPQLRRPSSSFFARPFHRVSSRTSVFDLESKPIDDGSFQLKGFRHVSGVSGLQDGLGADQEKAETVADATVALADGAAEDEWKPAPPARPSMSRPSSAVSVRTMDEMSAAKVSVAAFKRGIRRPSETVDRSATADSDEDDDVPLGMLNRSAIPRPASSASLSRFASPVIASPSVTAAPLPRPSTIHTNSFELRAGMTSPGSGIGLGLPSSSPVSMIKTDSDVTKDNANGRANGGTFVVKSGRSTRSLHSVDSRERERSMRSVTPDTRSTSIPPLSTDQSRAPTRSASPVSANKQHLADEEELIISPAKQKAQTSRRIGMADGDEEGGDDDERIKAAYARSRTASPTPGPAMMPLGIPLPHESPSLAEMEGLNLPPRPDEMEEEAVSPRSTHSAMSPRVRVSSVVDPLKRLSGFLSSSSLNKSAHGDEEGFDASLALHGLMFAEQDGKADTQVQTGQSPSSSPPPAGSVGGVRMSLQDRLNAIKPAIPRIQTDLSPSSGSSSGQVGIENGQLEDMQTPIARTHLSALAGRLTPIASQEGSSREDVSSESSGVRAKPLGPRDQYSSSSPTTMPAAAAAYANKVSPAIQLDDDDSADASDEDESSDEETLAQLKTRASRSTLNVSRPPPTHVQDDASSVGSSPRTARARLVSPSLNDLALGPVNSRMSSSSSPSVPKMSISPSESSTLIRPGMLHTQSSRSSLTPSNASAPGAGAMVTSPSAKSVSFADHDNNRTAPGIAHHAPSHTQMQPAPATRGRTAYSMQEAHTTASPASSQSGLTGDSVQGPMTPGEGSVVSMHRSRERPGMSSSQSSFSLNEDRSRRFSQTSVTAPSIAPSATDPAALSMMKQQWQAQFMAAAYAASEEQWERASSVGGAGDSMSQNGGYFGQHQHQQGIPMTMPFGYQVPGMSGMPAQNQQQQQQQQQMLGMGMPFGMQYPGMNMPMMSGMPGMTAMGMPMGMQFPFGMMGQMGQGMQGMQGMPGMPGIGMGMPGSPQIGAGGMYSYGPGAQSVFGGEFGPPTGHRGYSAHDVRSVSASASGNGMNGPGSGYVSSPLAQPPHGSSGGTAASRPSGSRHSRSTSNLRASTSASSVYGTATTSSSGVGATRTSRPRHHSNSRSVTALPTIQQSPQKDSQATPRQPSYGQSPLRPGPRAQTGQGMGDGARHSSYDLLSAAPPPPSSWRNGGSDVSKARPRTHYAS